MDKRSVKALLDIFIQQEEAIDKFATCWCAIEQVVDEDILDSFAGIEQALHTTQKIVTEALGGAAEVARLQKAREQGQVPPPKPLEPRTFLRMTYAEWRAEGMRRFGPNSQKWKFVCPVCKYVASMEEWEQLGAQDSAGFACIGRWRDKARDAFFEEGSGPCNYSGGGLFKLNPVTVTFPDGKEITTFAFAEANSDGA